MTSKETEDENPLTSFATMPLLSHYYQSMVSVQFTSGWRDYWSVLDQDEIYLCDAPCIDPRGLARVVLELKEDTRVQAYGNAISRRNKFCFILAPTTSAQTSRDNYHSVWRFSREADRDKWLYAIEGNVLQIQRRLKSQITMDLCFKSEELMQRVSSELTGVIESDAKEIRELLREIAAPLKTELYTPKYDSTGDSPPSLPAASTVSQGTWNHLSKSNAFPGYCQFELLLRGAFWPSAEGTAMRDQQNMMAIEMMSGLSSFRAPARRNDSDGSLENVPRIRFPNYSLRQVRNRSQTSVSSTGSTISSTPSPKTFDDNAQEWTPSTSGSTCYVLIHLGTMDVVGGAFKPSGKTYRTWSVKMSPSPFFPSAILAEVHRNDISKTLFRFEFVSHDHATGATYVVSRFEVSASRLLDVRSGTELELGSDYYPGRLYVQIRAPEYTKYNLVYTTRPMAQTYRVMRPERILGGLLIREETSEPHLTYLVPTKYLEMRAEEIEARLSHERVRFQRLPDSKRESRKEWMDQYFNDLKHISLRMKKLSVKYKDHFLKRVAFRGSKEKKGPKASSLAFVPVNLHVQTLTMLEIDNRCRWNKPMCDGERVSMLTWGSTAAHCEKFKHGKGLMNLLKKLYDVEYERLKLMQELADLEEQVKEDKDDREELKTILKKCEDRLKNQENLVWKLKEKSVLEQKECEDKKKVATKETLDALKDATEEMHECKRQVNSITADVKDMSKRIDKFGDRVSDLIDDSEKTLSQRQALVTKMQYRADIAFSCALTGMVTAFALHLEDLVKAGNKAGLENLLYLGFLVQQESLLSTYSKENGMLEDQYAASLMLNKVTFCVEEDKEWDKMWEKMETKMKDEKTFDHSAPTAVLIDENKDESFDRLQLGSEKMSSSRKSQEGDYEDDNSDEDDSDDSSGAEETEDKKKKMKKKKKKKKKTKKSKTHDAPEHEKYISQHHLSVRERKKMDFLLSRIRIERENQPLDVSVRSSSNMRATFRMDASDLRWAHVKARFGHPDFITSPRSVGSSASSSSSSKKKFSEQKKKTKQGNQKRDSVEEEVSNLIDDAMKEEKESNDKQDVVMGDDGSDEETIPTSVLPTRKSTGGLRKIMLNVSDLDDVTRVETMKVKTPTSRMRVSSTSHGDAIDDSSGTIGFMQDGGTVKGWLMKEGKVGSLWGFMAKPWQKRWFVLRSGRISWFSSKNIDQEQNSLLLDGYKVSKVVKDETGRKTWYAFELFAPLQRTLRLRCEKEHDARLWVDTLESHLRQVDPLAFTYFFAGHQFHVPPEKLTDSAFTTRLPDTIATSLEPLRRVKVTIKLPSRIFKQLPSKMRQGDPVQLRPVMFSQGINEAQVVADNNTTSTVLSLSNELQEVVNMMGLQLLQSYNREKGALQRRRRQAMMRNFNAETKKILTRQKREAVRCANLLENLEDVVQRSVKAHKTHFEILILAADTVRALGGFRLTNCMSGKDRTGMSVTLEESRLVTDRLDHGTRDEPEQSKGIRLMKRDSDFFLPEGSFTVQFSSMSLRLPKALRQLGHHRMSLEVSIGNDQRVSDTSTSMLWPGWKCEFSVSAPIPPTATVKFTLREPTVFKTSVMATSKAPLEQILRDCDVGSDVSLDLQPEGTTEIHKLIGRSKLSFKVLRLQMGRRDAKQIVGGARVLDLAALFRAHGPRLQNCRKNIHKAKYSLKLPARLALPFAYKPPKGSYGDGEA